MAGLLLLTIIIILCFIFRKYGNRLSFVSHLPFLINSTLKVGVYQTAEVTERAFLLSIFICAFLQSRKDVPDEGGTETSQLRNC